MASESSALLLLSMQHLSSSSAAVGISNWGGKGSLRVYPDPSDALLLSPRTGLPYLSVALFFLDSWVLGVHLLEGDLLIFPPVREDCVGRDRTIRIKGFQGFRGRIEKPHHIVMMQCSGRRSRCTEDGEFRVPYQSALAEKTVTPLLTCSCSAP